MFPYLQDMQSHYFDDGVCMNAHASWGPCVSVLEHVWNERDFSANPLCFSVSYSKHWKVSISSQGLPYSTLQSEQGSLAAMFI